MGNSKFKKFFDEVTTKELLTIRGATLICEIMDEEELVSKGGIILNSGDAKRGSLEENRLKVARVLAVGEGYMGENGESIPCDTEVGAVVIVPKYSSQTVSVFPGLADATNDKLVLIKEESILAMYETEEKYLEAKSIELKD